MNNNHAFIRYRALDACLRNRRRRYYFDDLMEVVNKVLYEFDGSEVKERTLHPYQMKQWNYRWYLVGLE